MSSRRLSLIPSILLFCSATVFAGQFVGNCDSGAAGRDKCLEWVASSVRALGCAVVPATAAEKCQLHPWGSDFVKSWVCTVDSPDCVSLDHVDQVDHGEHGKTSCQPGWTHVFKDDWQACWKTSRKPGRPKFSGICHHAVAVHTTVMTRCPEDSSVCRKLGGYRQGLSVLCDKKHVREPVDVSAGLYACAEAAKKCTQAGGALVNEWRISCAFRDSRITRDGASCEEIRKRCELGNSPNGPNGTLENCVPVK